MVHVQEADLAVQGVTKLQGHLNGTALLIEGSLILGLNETFVMVAQNRTYYSLIGENVSAEFRNMDLTQAQRVVSSQNLTFAEHVTSRTVELPPFKNVTRVSQFQVAGETGDLSSKGSLTITQNAVCLGDVTLSTRLDRVSE
jgi:hypothetical protein